MDPEGLGPLAAPSQLRNGIIRSTQKAEPWILPITLIGALVVLLVPVPGAVMDLLLAANITVSVLILMTTITIATPQQFSSFPTLLLTTTLTRLVLNVASTRLILLDGAEKGLDAAGGVIRAFGSFVAGDNILVGGVMFGIMVIIQFVVITKGSSRISEVAARFMLDGLPGRQMAIDADLHAGLIDQPSATRRRNDLYRQADFFGAMDGAGKYVRGDAVAGVLITLINVAGGMFIGVIQHGMSPAEAVDVFTKLTIGDGLVSQIPAFLISLAAGLIVTRSSSESDIGHEMTGQLFGQSRTLIVSAALLGLLAFFGLPKLPLLTVAGLLTAGAWVLYQSESEQGAESEQEKAITAKPQPNQLPVAQVKAKKEVVSSAQSESKPKSPAPASASPPSTKPATSSVNDWLRVDAMELSIGYRLITLADASRGGDLLDRLQRVRQRVARELGMIAPQVAIRDDIALGPQEYRISIRGVTIATGSTYPGRLLAILPAGMDEKPEGRETIDPATGQPATWIVAEGREAAELSGCKLKDASAVLMDHLAEIIIGHADELLSRDQVMQLAPTLHDVRRVEKLDLLGELGEPVLELLVLADAREDLVALERLGELLKHADHLRLRLFPHLLLLVHQCRVDLTKLVLKLGRVHQHEQQHLGLATLLREEGGRRGEHWHARRGPY